MAIVALIGRPNVGKSSLFNRIIGMRRAIEAEEPGTTRDRLYEQITHKETTFTLVDVAGIAEAEGELEESIADQITVVKDEADLFLLVTDAQAGLLSEDQHVIDMVRPLGKPVVVLVNKADSRQLVAEVEHQDAKGFIGPFATSAIHNSGIADVLDAVVKHIPHTKTGKSAGNTVSIALVGRPNVGKSTLLNQLAGEKRAVVSNVAGTTRDAVDITIPYKELQFKFVDTAGIRRRGKIETGIEQFSVLRTIRAIEDADIVILMIDATDGPAAGDAHIAGIALDLHKGLVLAVNKWDIREKIKIKNLKLKIRGADENEDTDEGAQRQFLSKLQDQLSFALWAPAVFISALDGLNTKKLLEVAWRVVHTRAKVLDQETLGAIKQAAEARHPHLPKIYSFEQLGTNPPTFAVVINRPETWHFSFSRFIENLIREAEAYNGTSIKIELKAYSKSQK